MDTQTLIENQNRGVTVITRTERLAREMRFHYSVAMREAGHPAWEAPNIISLQRWMLDLWELTWPTDTRMHPAHHYNCYRQVIETSEAGAQLLSGHHTAKLAMQADNLVNHYQLDITAPAFGESQESTAFTQWHQSVKAVKAEQEMVTETDVLANLVADQAAWITHSPEQMVLCGFYHLTPLQSRLLDVLREAGIEVTVDKHDRPEADISLQVFDSPGSETRAAMRYIQDLLIPYQDNPAAAPSVALVVPDLTANRHRITSLLYEYLAPAARLPGNSEQPLPWHVVTGEPLDRNEMVDSAMMILRLRSKSNFYEDISSVLLNRRVAGNGKELSGRAKLDRMLRKQLGRRVSIEAIAKRASDYAPKLGERLSALKEELDTQNGAAYPSTWAARYKRRLHLMGWPGEDDFCTETYQAYESFQAQLEALASLDKVYGKIAAGRAIQLLSEILKTALFQVRPAYYAPVHVMELDDISGHSYDHVVAINMTDHVIPRRADPNPLLPVEMQREAGIPGASADILMAEARELIAALKRLGSTLWASCANMSEEGRLMTPTPLLGHWPETVTDMQEAANTGVSPVLESTSEAIPAVGDIEAETMAGGVRVIADQAKGGFYAFVSSRLSLQPLPEPAEGLDPAAQGELIHRLLELFWLHVKSSDTLNAMSDAELHELIVRLVDDVTHESTAPYPLRSPSVAQLERERLTKLAKEWIALEKRRRDPFEVVAPEQRTTAALQNGLSVEVRIDRIDKVFTANGEKYLVWDYKSGFYAKPEGWSPQELTEPQLPLYATTADFSELGFSEPDGIAMGRVALGACNAFVWSNFTGNLIGSKNDTPVRDWPGLLAQWRDTLNEHAADFMAGDGRLDVASLGRYQFTHGFVGELVEQDASTE